MFYDILLLAFGLAVFAAAGLAVRAADRLWGAMTIDLVLGGALALVLLVYLLAALFAPGRF